MNKCEGRNPYVKRSVLLRQASLKLGELAYWAHSSARKRRFLTCSTKMRAAFFSQARLPRFGQVPSVLAARNLRRGDSPTLWPGICGPRAFMLPVSVDRADRKFRGRRANDRTVPFCQWNPCVFQSLRDCNKFVLSRDLHATGPSSSIRLQPVCERFFVHRRRERKPIETRR